MLTRPPKFEILENTLEWSNLWEKNDDICDKQHPQLKCADDCVFVGVTGTQSCRLVLVPDDQADNDAAQRVDGGQQHREHVQLYPSHVSAVHAADAKSCIGVANVVADRSTIEPSFYGMQLTQTAWLSNYAAAAQEFFSCGLSPFPLLAFPPLE